MHKNTRFNIYQAPGNCNPNFVVIDGQRTDSGNLAHGAKIISDEMSRDKAIALADKKQATADALVMKKIAQKLNDHHMKTCAGFYLSNGHRCFGARVKDGKLEVMYWLHGSGEEYWMLLDLEATKVTDHNGREIFLT